jgi:methionyl-tRNA formyltransferase
MRLVMLGTGPFAVPTLRQLLASPHEVARVVTRPPRGRRAEPSPMQLAAEELGIAVWQPETINGDAETGNTVIQMTPGLDAGPILGVDRVPIDPDETAGDLEARLAQRGGDLVLSVIDALAAGTTKPIPQDKTQASKAPRLQKEHGQIDWTKPAAVIKNQIRALDPWPRAYTHCQRPNGELTRLIIHRAQVGPDATPEPMFPGSVPLPRPGAILEAGPRLLIATGEGALELLQIQPAGKRVMTAAELLRGYPLAAGQQLQ